MNFVREALLERGMAPHVKAEIGIMQVLHHPHIIALKEVLRSTDSIFMVLEYVCLLGRCLFVCLFGKPFRLVCAFFL